MGDRIIITGGKKDDDSAGALVVAQGISTFGDILKEAFHAAMSSPVLAAAMALWLNSMLVKAKLVDDNTGLGVGVLIFSAAGIELSSEVIQDFTKLTTLSGNGNPGFFASSGTTLVFTESDTKALQALLSQLAAKK